MKKVLNFSSQKGGPSHGNCDQELRVVAYSLEVNSVSAGYFVSELLQKQPRLMKNYFFIPAAHFCGQLWGLIHLVAR